ncbi:MAG: RNA 3'-terminal phosphate cyclase [Phycisphaerales bacterium]
MTDSADIMRAAVAAGPPVDLDGTMGEGGGQVLRSALALSILTGRPLRIENIRGGRPRPGLMRQHLTAVRAAATICNGQVAGDELGSCLVGFQPGPVAGGTWTFDIGSAGSTSLVLQTILLPLVLGDGPSRVTIIGGTHNPAAPTSDYLERAWLPLVRRMGAKVTFSRERYGFMPAGGGRIVVDVEPIRELESLDLVDGGEITGRSAVVLSSHVPNSVGKSEAALVRELTGWSRELVQSINVDEASNGPGNAVRLELQREHVTEIFTGLGRRGRRGDDVVRSVVEAYRRHLVRSVPVGPHLADQLMLPLAVAGGGAFRTGPLTKHSQTNIDVIERFLDVRFAVQEDASGTTVRVATGR